MSCAFQFVGKDITAKILKQARLQNEELLEELTPEAPAASSISGKSTL